MLKSIVALVAKTLGFSGVPFFDPDRDLWQTDKLEHFAGVALLTLALSFVFPNVVAAGVAILAALTFELGQWDVLRTAAPHLIGEPGYGFGVLDLIVGAAGAVSVVIILALV